MAGAAEFTAPKSIAQFQFGRVVAGLENCRHGRTADGAEIADGSDRDGREEDLPLLIREIRAFLLESYNLFPQVLVMTRLATIL